MIITLQSIFIGIIQGITEFLPISSSAHLVTIPYMFDWTYQGLSFDVALHFGTFLAILIYFYKDWLQIFSSAFNFNKQSKSIYPKNILWQIIIASIPSAILGFLIADKIESHLHSPIIIAINLIVFGIILYIADSFTKKNLNLDKLNFGKSIIVGLAQMIALIPGVSRSGITISAGRTIGLNREDSAKFSFLLGTPAVFGATVLQFTKVNLTDINLSFILGMLASMVTGYLVIKFLLSYLKKSNFNIFVYYRIILAILILLIYFYK